MTEPDPAQALEHELRKKEADARIGLEKAAWEAEHALNKLFHTTIAEVAKGAIDRSRDSAKYVQTAAAAISGLYAGLLGLVFSVTDNPLPLRGVFASAFLGLAVALSTAYLAFITKPKAPPIYGGGSALAQLQLERSGYLTRFVNATVHNRRWAIRASVLSLAFGVAFIAAPFVSSNPPDKVPPAPTAPAVPQAVPPPLTEAAVGLFQSQVEQFTAASEARTTAIENAKSEAEAYERRENDANRLTFVFALIALALTTLGPLAIRDG